jgi:hypothetical protein
MEASGWRGPGSRYGECCGKKAARAALKGQSLEEQPRLVRSTGSIRCDQLPLALRAAHAHDACSLRSSTSSRPFGVHHKHYE